MTTTVWRGSRPGGGNSFPKAFPLLMPQEMAPDSGWPGGFCGSLGLLCHSCSLLTPFRHVRPQLGSLGALGALVAVQLDSHLMRRLHGGGPGRLPAPAIIY